MMYMGSKSRVARHILPIMLQDKPLYNWWVEPFVGGGNMIDKVSGRRLGGDANCYAIEALLAIRDHVHLLPKNNTEFTEDDYNSLIKGDSYPYKGYAGFAFSFGGKWLGGWSRRKNEDYDYVKSAYNSALRQSPKLKGVHLVVSNYETLYIPPRSLIYCDPPYRFKTGYKGSFDHDRFWQWCREKAQEGHGIFISEYEAPPDFICVWQKAISNKLAKKKDAKIGTEKLYKYNF